MPNRLAGETSPYLLQHADNPVDWYPWGPEALARARDEDKPILLSIGYSACHWCHVMAHESFEDPAVAAVMNALFVNVKVDREERPDLDQIYQTAHAMLAGRGGGWPLTVVLTPDQTPFFAGTYFPKSARHGLPGFADLLRRIADAYRRQGEAIAQQNQRLREALESTQPERSDDAALGVAPIDAAVASLAASFDAVDGGFGQAPKFPHTPDLELCLRHHLATGDPQSLRMATLTLSRMAAGGIFDHLGGGFCRYSVDAQWTIPHFEKMLYDNAQLLPLYADAWRIGGDEAFAETARATARWVIDALQAPDGGFRSSFDADSEGEEGKYYVWSRDEVRALLDDDAYGVFAPRFGLDGPPNFEGHAWHLRVSAPLLAIAERLGIGLDVARARLQRAHSALRGARARRVPPACDDKILTSWNALMIGGLARAARTMNEPEWLEAARRALAFVRARLWSRDRLLASWRDGKAHLPAYLDDHAFLLAALLECMQAGFREQDYDWAIEIAELLLDRFEDPADGGFFFTAHDHEQLIHRPKTGHDNATPSGNGVAARALIDLGHLAGEPRYLDAAERALRLFASQFGRQPGGFATMLLALDEYLEPPTTVVLRGAPEATGAWARALAGEVAPGRLVIDTADRAVPAPLAKPGGGGAAGAGAATAWVCPGSRCLPAVADLDALRSLLAEAGARRRPGGLPA